MTDAQVIQLAGTLNYITMVMACLVLLLMLNRIRTNIANTNDLAVTLITILVISAMCWIIWGADNIWTHSGAVTRMIFILIYTKLFFVAMRRTR